MAGGAGSAIGRGGMLTKVLAAKRAARSGARDVIACGPRARRAAAPRRRRTIGTELVAPTAQGVARKLWMSDHLQLRGSVTVDAGAATQLRDEGKSLLPIGVVAVPATSTAATSSPFAIASGEEIGRGSATTAAPRHG